MTHADVLGFSRLGVDTTTEWLGLSRRCTRRFWPNSENLEGDRLFRWYRVPLPKNRVGCLTNVSLGEGSISSTQLEAVSRRSSREQLRRLEDCHPVFFLFFTGEGIVAPDQMPIRARSSRYSAGPGVTASCATTCFYTGHALAVDCREKQPERARQLLRAVLAAGNSIRDYILQNSNLVLQDDTGVPFRNFAASKWHVQLFGAYSHPDPPFQREYQSDLARAFRAHASVRALGFSLGYGAGRRPSILMLARRKNATPSNRQISLRR
jgi:hypothetical protein